MSKAIDPTCLLHGKKLSTHTCLYCCLCFKTLTPPDCHARTDGQRENVCHECAGLEELQCTGPFSRVQDCPIHAPQP